ncbi:MAG TPA: hypothetical protein VMZ00_14780 [Sporichthya sp.]|nr:hypothetical protein [Sporichthya sp.]
MNTPLQRASAFGAVVVATGGSILMFGPAAKAVAPENLASYAAFSSATPYGIVSRVPAETDGGFLYSSSGFNVGKAQAKAADFTLGELGDLFVVSSAPPGTITSPPTVIYAQDPPQETAPNEASLSGGRSGGANGEVRNFDLEARANDAPSALATAAGNAVISPTYNSGYSTSRSESTILKDGTVATKAITVVNDIAFGVPGAMLQIASAKSIASITIAPGKKPVTELVTQSYGATLAGVPVTIDENGISINNQVAMPGSSATAFFAALASLKENGLTFEPGPRVVTTTDDGASITGAVFTYRHVAPPAPEGVPAPSDIGKDETFNLASVTAVASSRVRQPLTLGGTPAGIDSAGSPAAAIPSTGATGVDGIATAPLAPGVLPGLAPVAVGAAPGQVAFALPTRVANPLPKQMADSYRFVLIAALMAIGGIFFLAKNRVA